MPIKRVQFPDGSIHRVEVPDGATNEQIIAFVQSQVKPKADFSSVQSRADTVAQERPSDPTQGMGQGERFAAGVGHSLYETGRGIRQFVSDAMHAGTDPFVELATGTDPAAERRAVVDAQRRLDAPLLDTGAGLAGSVTGTVGQLLVPGGAAMRYGRGSQLANMIRSASMPRSVSGMSAQGGIVGLLQPVGEDDSRIQNATTGGLFGLLGGALPRGVGGSARAVRDTVGRFTRSGATRRAVEQVQREATDAASLMRPQPSQIPGVQRTLAQESLDPGVARLERNVRSTVGGFDAMDSASNVARTEAIRNTFEGASTASANAIKAARDQAAAEALDALPNAGAIPKEPIRLAIEGAIDANKGNRATQGPLRDLLDQLPEVNTAREAYNFRKYLDFLMSRQSDKPVLRAAKRELQMVKSAVDKAMTQAYPGWQQYLDDYVAMSRRADQAKAGAALLRKGSAIPDAITGEIPLSPAQVSRVVADPDAFAAQVTRFPQARADTTFTPEQTGLLRLLGDDLSRVNAARTLGSGGNSQTFERLATQDRIGTSLLGRVPLVGGLAGEVAKIGDRKVQEAVAEILADPSKYRSIVARFPANQRRVIEDTLARIGGTTGALTPALAE